MKKVSTDEIGFYGRPIDRLSREELIQALIELASAVKEFASDNKRCAKLIFIKSDNKKAK